MIAAPDDPIWQMFAVINGRVDGSELLVVLSAFVDEAGTGDEPNIILAALVGEVAGWIKFNSEWQDLLNRANLDYAHCNDMRRGRGKYAGWSINKKIDFSMRSFEIIKGSCLFGFTISLNKELFKTEYRDKLPPKVPADSAYAVCATEVFGHALRLAEHHLDYTGPMNFIFESGHRNSANAAQVFNDLKQHVPELSDRLGFFSLDDKKRIKPLQAADHIAYNGRRGEPAQKKQGFKTVGQAQEDGTFVSVADGGCPILYFALDEERLAFYREQAGVLKSIKKWRGGA